MVLQKKLKKYGEAFKYFKKANQTFEKNEFYYGVMLISSNLGISYLELNKLDSSYLYFKQSEAVMNEIGANDPSIKGKPRLSLLQDGQPRNSGKIPS